MFDVPGVWLVVVSVAVAAAILFVVLWLRARSIASNLRARFGPVVDLEAERQRVERERDRLKVECESLGATATKAKAALQAEIDARRSEVERDIDRRRSDFETKYTTAMADLERLQREVGALEDVAELQSFGLYKPYYNFDDSARYKARLEEVRAQQAAMLKGDTAAVCTKEWTVDGDKRKGRQMTARNLKLMLRAFNGECDALVAKVRFNNVVAIEERIRKAFEAINKLGEPNACRLANDYLSLKIAELRLTHELAEKIQQEKEEQREARDRMREEEVAQREFERAQREAEKEEQRYAQALAKARADLEATVGAKHARAEAQIAELERRLADAQAAKERAISQAQLTRSGHVYVISNIGSFGENVFKIGMTRRLEPMDRVREFGDASVPFAFDVHAIIYSEDAPSLESSLHRVLSDRRLNMVNFRKEFFAASLDEIEVAARQHAKGEFEFVRVAVAEEYRKSQAMRAAVRAPAPDQSMGTTLDAERGRFEDLRKLLSH